MPVPTNPIRRRKTTANTTGALLFFRERLRGAEMFGFEAFILLK
jgi:hypothetical protein